MSGRSSDSSFPDPPTPAAAIIVAGGSGRRMGAPGTVRKQYLEILGEPVLLRAVRPFLEHPRVGQVVVVLPPADVHDLPSWLRALPVHFVAGGAERSDSVWNGLLAVPPGHDLVLIHDGARPFVTRAVIDRVLARAPAGGAVAAVRVSDTLKAVDDEGRIVSTVDRSRLWQAQTPQGFPLATIRAAHRRAREDAWQATDDASLCERLGVPVHVVEGDPANLKITHPGDLVIAEALARALLVPGS